MGEWKVPLSLRVRQELRAGLEEFAEREKRVLGNLGVLLVEWGFEQLKVAGSTDRLLQCGIRLTGTTPTATGGLPGNKKKEVSRG
ncbi:MAG: hypothetical protein LAN61_04825 [Acidobacteriia bacterium]|nr:hypothetical protein [Terriglobia bacterium]